PGPPAVVSTAGFALEQGSSFPTGPLAGQTIDFLAVNSFGLGVNGLGDIINEATVGGVGGLYSQNGLVIADGVIDGVDGEFAGGVDINDSGSFVSSFSDFDTIDQGIVVDGSLVLTNLDSISGFNIQTLLFSNSLDLNNNGDFVFDAELIDPTTSTTFNAVVRATLVPEPTSLSLLGLGVLALACRRRQSKVQR
ncbi:MAG: PEP-CTERM sorting domain-containing protein, partial [Planctomycetota bacterium]